MGHRFKESPRAAMAVCCKKEKYYDNRPVLG